MEVQVKQSLLRKFAIQSERDRRGGRPFLVRNGCSGQVSLRDYRRVVVDRASLRESASTRPSGLNTVCSDRA